MQLKRLNLYAGIGGNRKKWGHAHKVTAVEFDPVIAAAYAKEFPGDDVIVGDAHEYLRKNYKAFDFIWSSPPCQSHASFRKNICVRFRGTEPVYPDMKLYQEIIFLQGHANCKWVVENVRPYYTPLINPTVYLQRHLIWSNFAIGRIGIPHTKLRSAQIPELSKHHGFDLKDFRHPNKRQVLRNCVSPEVGAHVLNCALMAT